MDDSILNQQERGNIRQHLTPERQAELEKLVKRINEEQTDSGFAEMEEEEEISIDIPDDNVDGKDQHDRLQEDPCSISDLEEKTNRLTIQTHGSDTSAEITETSEEHRNQQAQLINFVEKVKNVVKSRESNQDGDTFLHVTIIHRSKFPRGLAEFVVTSSPDTDYLNGYNVLIQTPIQLAVITRESRVVRTLMEHGARIDLPDRNGNLPLHTACENGDVACVAEITRPMHDRQFAADFPNIGYSLLESVNATNYNGFTALQLAAMRGHKQIVQYLVQTCGADVDAQDGKSGQTALHHAVEANNLDMIMHLILKCNVDVNAQSRSGCTSLHIAAGRGLDSIANFLLAAGADQGIENDEGDIPSI